jgi:hypothetical protein
MFARTRGPSRNPACAATKSSAASAARLMITKALPNGKRPKRFERRIEFIVLPATGCELVRR